MDGARLVLFVVGIGCGIGAIAVAPRESNPDRQTCAINADCPQNSRCNVLNQRRVCIESLPPPPKTDLVRTVSLGRFAAAADLIWLQVVQYVGSASAQANNFQGLAPWILTTTELNPRFQTAYWYAGSLLPTSPSSAADAERILKRGEQVQGEDWQLAMWRGFVAYYGRQDRETAAAHFERSVKLGGPEYLTKRAQTLRTESKNCRDIQRNLAQMRRNVQGAAPGLLTNSQVQKIVIGCLESRLEAAIVAYRVNHGDSPKTIADLLEDGLLEEAPPAPQGQCWFLGQHEGYLAPCVGGRRSDLAPPKRGQP